MLHESAAAACASWQAVFDGRLTASAAFFVLSAVGCTAANGRVSCFVGSLGSSVAFRVTLPATALQAGNQTTSATVNTTSLDTVPSNNAAQHVVVALVSVWSAAWPEAAVMQLCCSLTL
jgi:hypothetical protein